MHRLLLLAILALAACSESQASRVAIDNRTFKLETPGMPDGGVGPNRRRAEELCPKGYRVLDESKHKDDPSNGIITTWTIRCL